MGQKEDEIVTHPFLIWPVILSTSPRYSSLHSNTDASLKAEYESGNLNPILGKEYVSQEEMYRQSVKPDITVGYDRAKKQNMTPSLANLLGHAPTNRHQGTPTESGNFLKLQNVLNRVQDVWPREPRTRHVASMEEPK